MRYQEELMIIKIYYTGNTMAFQRMMESSSSV